MLFGAYRTWTVLQVGEAFPEIYVKGGIMERGNFSACAGFSSHSSRCAVFGTFAAFQEMILSEAASGWHGKEVGKSIDVTVRFGCIDGTDRPCLPFLF